MPLRAILQTWLQNTARAKVQEAVVRAAKQQLAQPPAEPPAEEPQACHVGLVFALGIESGCFEDLLQGLITIRGTEIPVREGGLKGKRVAIVLSGPGRARATRAAEILIDGHRPGCVISAGFAGALSPQLRRYDILIADRLLSADGRELPLELPPELSSATRQPGVHCGPLLTADRVVRMPEEKRSLYKRHAALAVDMETFAVAEVCRRRQVPFASIRVIVDVADERLPRDVEHLLSQKTNVARFGAALGAAWRRPTSVKEMYQLRENSLVASGRLARFLTEIGST
jgi:adenosylhomocysteine nucleosidase